MLADIEKFIYNNKIYSKCNESEKEMINTCIHGVRQQLETFKYTYKQAQEEIALLKRENKALADDNEMKCELNKKLGKGLEKACFMLEKEQEQRIANVKVQLGCDIPIMTKEQWMEWSLHNEKI